MLAWEKPEALSERHSLTVETMNRAQERPKREREGGRLRGLLFKIS